MNPLATQPQVRFVLMLLLAQIEIDRVAGQATALLPYGSPCTHDMECDPYSPRLAYQVKCDKKSVLDATGVCGCTGDIYTNPPPGTPVSHGPIFGYVEEFDMTKPTDGCRRTSWILAACNAGLNTCERLGIPIINGEAPVVCRNILNSLGYVEFKCVGRERRTRTFGYCGMYAWVDCASLPDSICQPQPAVVASLKTCVPRILTGSPPVLVDPPVTGNPADFYCHHDTDCRDLNAKCIPVIPETVTSGTYTRGFCSCDERQGYIYTIINGKEKCVVGPGYGERCNSKDDCAVGGGVFTECIPLISGPTPATTFSTCQCTPFTDPLTMRVIPSEYFEGPRPDEAECRQINEFNQVCDPDIALNRDRLPVHNCRKRNARSQITGLQCPLDVPIPQCACLPSAEWDGVEERCVRKFVDLDEICGTGPGLLSCNPEGYLACIPIIGTPTSRCVCSANAYRDPDGFEYCRLHQTVVGYGEVCDELSLLCNDQLNLICRFGRCRCLPDEFIIDTFAECLEAPGRTLNKNKKSSAEIGPKRYALTFYIFASLSFISLLSSV